MNSDRSDLTINDHCLKRSVGYVDAALFGTEAQTCQRAWGSNVGGL